MEGVTDRTWPLPKYPWVLRMQWSQLLFAHWPVPPEIIASRLPAGLELDTWDGSAWIGVVPFFMSGVAPRGCPSVPRVSRFLELNVRTYVTRDGKPGVWFFSLEAESRIAVRLARWSFCLPYMDASMSLAQSKSGVISYTSERTHLGEPAAHFQADYQRAGDYFMSKPGSLEHWLTARYCLYSADREGRVFRGEIDHPPWTLAPAQCDISRNTMCESLNIPLAGNPHLLCAQAIAVRAWLLSRCP